MNPTLIHRSRHADVAIPEVTLPELIDAVARHQPDLVAAIDAVSGREVTYGEFVAATSRVASGIAARGLGSGAVVAIVAANSIDWLVAALGVIGAGGVVTGANPGYTTDELAHQLRDSGARAVITTPDLFDTVTRAAGDAELVREVIVFGDPPVSEVHGMVVLPFSELAGADELSKAPAIGLDDLCALPYSSGTTGRSKGVRLTHRTLVSNVTQIGSLAPLGPGDRTLAFLPMFHIFGFAVISLCTLSKGGTIVTVPGFVPNTFLGAIRDYRVSSVFVVPPVANFLAAHPLVDDFDLSSLEMIGCGAAPLGAATEEKLKARLGCEAAQGYGMTESSGTISYPDFGGEIRAGSSGRLLPNTEAMIVDPATGESQPAGATGEIWFRGPQVFAGYLHNPEATAGTINADGWVMTGDLGHFDEDGFLFLTDRLKELIKVKAFQVAPAELEALLFTHPDVADVAVIGRPDERSGEIPVAYIVPRTGNLDPNALRDWVAERVSEHKRLGDVIITDAIPKTPSGKILRRVLRETDAR